METRLFGIFNGLKVAKAAGFHIVNCESNSQITLKMIFQGNACANWLAKSGANSQDHFRLLSFCPTPMHYLLLTDAKDYFFLRV
ncbi:hypothetical protein JHK82_024862 [Glycine max]|nr:hypothetical protein JHK87_024803 [Glycine soja]KAG5012717.1 hypothetical protein JHK86_024978 [Glycine max]KAG5133674.1 hypothetical protein JHK82_024862 [Glycine max]